MATDIIVSSLPLSAQLARLRSLLAKHGYILSPEQGERICRSLNLGKPCPGSTAVDRLSVALRACGIRTKRTLAFEAIAAMCGQDSWMRQLALPLSQPAARYVVQITRESEEDSQFIESDSLSALGKALREHVRQLWPQEMSPALCTLRVVPKAITFEFEHPHGPWLSGHILKLVEGPDAPTLADLPENEVRRFVPDLQRALEYGYPGLLVLGGLRTELLPPWYEFAPIIREVASGNAHVCTGELDLFAVLDGYEIAHAPIVSESGHVMSADGIQRLESRWSSAVDGAERFAPIAPAALTSLRNRVARLRGVTGSTMMQFFARLSTGKSILRDCHRFDTRALEDRRKGLGISVGALAERAGIELPDLLRMRKYGWSDTRALPALARALKIDDPNELLPPVDEDRLGMRIERGGHFIEAVGETHWWRRIIGEGLEGAEAEAVDRIAAALQEWVDLLQFATGPFGQSATGCEEPITEERVAVHIQEHLDELAALNVAVIVERSIRYVAAVKRLPGMERSPLNHATLYLEKVGRLRPPGQCAA